MNKRKVRVVKLFVLVTVVCMFTFMLSSLAIASTVYNTTQSSELWGIGEYDEGGSAIIPCSAYCSVRIFEDYTKPTSDLFVMSKHTVFAWAQNWTGNAYGYSLDVTASPSVTYKNGSTTLGSVSLSYDSNVLTDSNWVWDNKSSTTSRGYSCASITASSYGTFCAPDAIIYLPIYWKPSTRTLDASVSF